VYYPEFQYVNNCLAQIVTSGPTARYPEIMQGFVRIILAARRYIYIETPYFLPNEPILFALKTAALAGVDVRVMCPLTSDAHFIDWASRSYLREVYEAGARVYLYEPGFLHSKLLVSDDSLVSCGSTNVDSRSFENNFEANAFIYDEGVAIRLRNVFLRDQEDAVLLSDLPQRIHPSFKKRLWESLIRLLSPLL
jgi:cardiolipin synthase